MEQFESRLVLVLSPGGWDRAQVSGQGEHRQTQTRTAEEQVLPCPFLQAQELHSSLLFNQMLVYLNTFTFTHLL